MSTPSQPAIGGKNLRPCPALNGFIKPADCGAQRGSKLKCPSECPFFPFGLAGFDLWLKTDRAWVEKVGVRAMRVLGDRVLAQAAATFRDTLRVHYEVGYLLAIYDALLVRRDAQEKTVADLWAADGWRDLNNDERIMMESRRQSFVTVIEIQKVLDEQTMQCVDLLDPTAQPFVVLDRAMARRAIRFSRLLGWLSPFPQYFRLGSAAFFIQNHLWAAWLAEVNGWLAEDRKTRPELSLRQFLGENLIDAAALIGDLSDLMRQQILQSLDLFHCAATYSLTGKPEEIQAVLQSKPDFEPGETTSDSKFEKPLAFYHWLRRGESVEVEKTMPGVFQSDPKNDRVGVLGSVRLYPNRLIIEAFSKKKYAFARQQAEKYFGSSIRFEKESVLDLAKLEREREQAQAVFEEAARGVFGPEKHVASNAEEAAATNQAGDEITPDMKRRIGEQTHREFYAKFLDDAIPSLDGQTPRAAAKDAALRPRLVDLMKDHINSLEYNNRRDGTRLSLDEVLDELGLPELK